jgi:glucose-1-phosphate thymidylyltransferase
MTRPIAVIPVAGVGTRLRPHTHTVPKALLHVAGKPILAHIVDELIALGVDEMVFVVGHMGDRIREYVDRSYRIPVHYVEQEERKGLGHAVHLTESVVGGRPVLIVLGDTIFKADFSGVLAGERSLVGVKEVEDPRRFGIAETRNGTVTHLVEKPDRPTSNLALVGIYYLRNSPLLFACLREIVNERHLLTKGEYQLTDALELMIERGESIGTFPVAGWYDCGKTETLLETNRDLLDLANGAREIPGNIVKPPVAIDPTAVIENSIVGPYATVAAGASVRNSVVKNSIINENASVEDILLDASVVGDHAVVRGAFKRLNVGDSSEIQLS